MPDPATPERTPPAAARQALCTSGELQEKGRAIVFDVLHDEAPATAFALRFDGRVVAYLNRCAHLAAEMDWQPGEFLDHDKRWIVCAMHGASYEPANGRCVGGPCNRGRLIPVKIQEIDGQACWYPSADIRPPPLVYPLPAAQAMSLADPPASESPP